MTQAAGGSGGSAEVEGDGSDAQGGAGGAAVGGGAGGAGGYARVKGNNSRAVGGRGGRGGIGPGSPGGDAEVDVDNAASFGGGGGEAAQHDGRGGRGGRAAIDDAMEGENFAELFSSFGALYRPGHIKTPYGHAPTEPGRGGDALDTPQYMARRIIVEDLKRFEFVRLDLSLGEDGHEAWYDRTVVNVDWINATLLELGHHWQMTVVDDEYEFHSHDVRATD